MLIPDNETEVDFLNCEAISRTVAQLLKENRKRALTIGIHGDWGAGKSSILRMVECELKKDQSVACLWFNGWTFQGFDDAKTVLIEATIAELCRQRSAYGKVKEIGSRLIKRVDWLKLAKKGAGLGFNLITGLPSPDQIETALTGLKSLIPDLGNLKPTQIEERLNEAASFLKPSEPDNVPDAIHDFRQEFSELLDEAKIEQLVVLIDDLDRCLPSTAIDTLEAIRLFLFVPKTAFIIGADEAMIEYAVRQHFPDLPVASGPVPYARNYLEKLIQVPFRIPALGSQETRTYVLLLMIESIAGGDHTGFRAVLAKAKDSLNKPWLGEGLTHADVQGVDAGKREALDSAFLLAARIGPILAEGTKGNPRQIKRFLNALMIRQAIAEARGFGDLITQPILAKLMLAERFQPDFYDDVAALAMAANDGKVQELRTLELAVRQNTEGQTAETGKKTKSSAKLDTDHAGTVEKWLEREWLRRWLGLEPGLAEFDLRPYIFVARDKRMLAGTVELGGLEGLIQKLCGSGMALRMVEPEVKGLPDTDAQTVFNGLRERVLAAGNLLSPPPGFEGLGIVAKHHVRFQSELIAFIGSLDVKALGVWIVKGWNEVITEASAKDALNMVMNGWAQQDSNALLKRTAGQALGGLRAGRR